MFSRQCGFHLTVPARISRFTSRVLGVRLSTLVGFALFQDFHSWSVRLHEICEGAPSSQRIPQALGLNLDLGKVVPNK